MISPESIAEILGLGASVRTVGELELAISEGLPKRASLLAFTWNGSIRSLLRYLDAVSGTRLVTAQSRSPAGSLDQKRRSPLL